MKICLTALAALLLVPAAVLGWGDAHRAIMVAALDIQPEKEQAIQALGAENWLHIGGVGEVTGYCGLADNQGEYVRRPWCEFFANDYLLTREVPFLHGYHVPVIEEPPWNQQIAGFAKRALQALRTEPGVEAARRVGALLHFVEDAGATAHAARIPPPAHTLLDSTVPLDRIALPGYPPQLLGKTADAFVTALQSRIAALIDSSAPVGRRLKAEAIDLAPVYETARIGRVRERLDAVGEAQIPPALESLRATADALHTLLVLGLAPQKDGASLRGTIRWADTPAFEKSGAEIHLLDARKLPGEPTSPQQIFDACTGFDTHTDPAGDFAFHHLPEGDYRVLAYRVGSAMKLSEPIHLAQGHAQSVSLSLEAIQPAGNLVYNPTLELSTYVTGMPDRWMTMKPLPQAAHVCMSATVPVRAGRTLKFGAKLRDPSAQVTFFVMDRSKKSAVQDCSRTLKIDPAFRAASSFTGTGGEATATSPFGTPAFVLIYVTSSQPLAQAVENVWVIEEGERK